MVNRADSRILITQWIVDQLWILERIPDCACLDGQILGLKQNLDHRSFFSLSRYAMSSSKLFVFANEAHLNSGVRLMIGIVLWYSHQACCLLWTMELTFTGLSLNFYTSVSGCGWGFRFEKKNWRIDGVGEKRHGSADLHTPIKWRCLEIWPCLILRRSRSFAAFFTRSRLDLARIVAAYKTTGSGAIQ